MTIMTIFGRLWHKEINNQGQLLLYIADASSIHICQFELGQIEDNQKLTIETYVKITGHQSEAIQTRKFSDKIIVGETIQFLSQPSISSTDAQKNLTSIRFLFIRQPEIKYILLLKQKIRQYIIQYLEDQGYSYFETPIITSFPQVQRKAIKVNIKKPLNLFSDDKYLIQKSQYFLEALAHAFNKAYTITPAFRSDYRESNLLLTEFWLVEVEELFTTMTEQMDLVERILKFIISELLAKNKAMLIDLIKFRELNRLNSNNLVISDLPQEFWEKLEQNTDAYISFLQTISKPFPRLTFTEATDLLKAKGYPHLMHMHLREKRALLLTEEYDSPVFVYKFPFSKRRFYDLKCPKNENFTHTFDLLGHGGYGEIASGGEREYQSEKVISQIKEKKLRLENNQTLRWYSQYKKYGSVPHGGFSIGLERLTAWLTNTKHIGKTISFPRRFLGMEV